MALLRAEHISKSFQSGTDQLIILNHCNFSIQSGSSCAIIGASGSGKSTLLHILGGLEQPDSGQVFLSNQLLADLSQLDLCATRNQFIGFVYQFHHLLGEFSALENCAMPLLIRGVPHPESLERAATALASVGLGQRFGHTPSMLSGGERQRCAIARALAGTPQLLLADEPTGNLDEKSASIVFDLLQNCCKAFGCALVVVTHSLSLAQRLEQTVSLENGKLVSR